MSKDPFKIFLIILLIVTLGMLVVSNFRIYRKVGGLRDRKELLEQRVGELESERAGLEEGLTKEDTDEYWERRIREQGYKKPGEEVVMIIGDEGSDSDSSLLEQGRSIWTKILELLKIK